jgi:hypothetical protein
VKKVNTILKSKYLIFALLFFSFLYPIKAEETLNSNCTLEEKERLRKLASLTKITYEFKQYTNTDGTSYKAYSLIVNNFTSDFYIWDEERGLYINNSGDNIGRAEALMPSVTYKLPFYAADNSVCNGFLILTKTVYLPPYNYYSDDPLCKGYENYELCKKHSPIKIDSYEEFVSRLRSYIKNLEHQNNNEPIVNDDKQVSIWNKIAAFLVSNILYITVPIIIICTTVIVVIEVRKRRSIL